MAKAYWYEKVVKLMGGDPVGKNFRFMGP